MFGVPAGSFRIAALKIGVVAGNLDPRIGGGARFCREILTELTQRSSAGGHEWVIFGEKGVGVSWPESPQFSWQSMGPAGLLARCLPRRTNLLARRVKQEGCALVWFVGGGGFPDPVPCPYLATVWDVQHRTHPYLPEMQQDGEWSYREKQTAPFLQQAASVIAGTRTGAEELRSLYGIPENRILIVPHPVPRGFEGARVKTGVPYFLYPANFWPHKNHATLIRALALLPEKKAELVFTGQGRNRPFLEALARSQGVDKRIQFVGHVDDEKLRGLYLGAAGLVYSSLSGPENLPPLEAMAAGCPVINSDFPGAREQLGEAAAFVPPLDAPVWAAAMEKLLRAPGANEVLERVRQGRRLVQMRTPAAYVDAVLSWIEDFGAIRSLWA